MFGKLPKKTISRNYNITNKRLSCAEELVQNVSLWCQVSQSIVVWSNCNRTLSSKSRLFLCKKYELLLRNNVARHYRSLNTTVGDLRELLLAILDLLKLPKNSCDFGVLRWGLVKKKIVHEVLDAIGSLWLKEVVWVSWMRINSGQVDLSPSLPQGQTENFVFVTPC